MEVLVYTLSILAAILLMLVIMIQNPKGGGIDSTFGAANQLGSVQKTNDVVEKATWYLAIFIVVIAISSPLFISEYKKDEVQTETRIDPTYTDQLETNQLPIITNNPK